MHATRAQALIRDGYRCMLTGHVDEDHLDEPAVQPFANIPSCYTKPCHIVSPTIIGELKLRTNVVTLHSSREAAGRDISNGTHLRALQNILTLSHDNHARFDSLKLWLKPTVRRSCSRTPGCLRRPLPELRTYPIPTTSSPRISPRAARAPTGSRTGSRLRRPGPISLYPTLDCWSFTPRVQRLRICREPANALTDDLDAAQWDPHPRREHFTVPCT
jgi:hypothetical protein